MSKQKKKTPVKTKVDRRLEEAELYWSGFTKAAILSAAGCSLVTAIVILILTL